MRIFALTCSKNDSFSYELARQTYENWDDPENDYLKKQYHPVITEIDIEGDNTPHFTFYEYCNRNYLKRAIFTSPVTVPLGRGKSYEALITHQVYYKHDC